MMVWEIEFTGSRSNVAKIRKLVGRMENRDGDVSTPLLIKGRGGPYKVWQERHLRWTELYPGMILSKLNDVYVPKYGLIPDIQVSA